MEACHIKQQEYYAYCLIEPEGLEDFPYSNKCADNGMDSNAVTHLVEWASCIFMMSYV